MTAKLMTPDTSTAPQMRDNPLGFKIERILVPLDFSPASMEALDYAVWLAKQFRADIHLLHAYPPDEASSVPGGAHVLFQSADEVGPAMKAAFESDLPTLIRIPMVNVPTPTPGHWNINDIYRAGN